MPTPASAAGIVLSISNDRDTATQKGGENTRSMGALGSYVWTQTEMRASVGMSRVVDPWRVVTSLLEVP